MDFLVKDEFSKNEILNTFEQNLLFELFKKKEDECLNSIKYWRLQISSPFHKDFAESQIYFYQKELEHLKSLQLKLIKQRINIFD